MFFNNYKNGNYRDHKIYSYECIVGVPQSRPFSRFCLPEQFVVYRCEGEDHKTQTTQGTPEEIPCIATIPSSAYTSGYKPDGH